MPLTTIKDIQIENLSSGTPDQRYIGAEAQCIEVARDSSGDIIEDINPAGGAVTPTSVENLSTTLKNLEDYDSTPDSTHTKKPISSAGVANAINGSITSTETKAVSGSTLYTEFGKTLYKQPNATGDWDTAPVDGSTKPVTSDGIYEDNKKTREITALVEDGTTVAKANISGQSYAYAIGDQFIRNGVLYKATATISNGATWSAITSSYTTADDITSQIQALTTKTTGGFGTLKNRKFIFVGDSYAKGTHGATGWIDLVNTKLGLTRGTNSFDSRDVSEYYGGSFGAGTFLTQINNCLSLIDNANDITDIYVFAGQNEPSNTDAQTATGIDNFCARAKEIYPNAVVHIGFVGLAKPSNYENILAKLIQYISGAGRNGADYVTNIECVNRRYSDVNSDGIHPNSYEEMASYMASAILNGSIDVVRYAAYTNADPITGQIQIFNLSVYQYNHSIKIKVNFALTNFSAIPSNEYINCANIPVLDFVCAPAYTYAPFNNNNANTRYEEDRLLVKINPSTNKLQIRNTQLNENGWVSAPAPIRLSPFDIVHIESTCFA